MVSKVLNRVTTSASSDKDQQVRSLKTTNQYERFQI